MLESLKMPGYPQFSYLVDTDVFPVVASLNPKSNLVNFRVERSDDRKYACVRRLQFS